MIRAERLQRQALNGGRLCRGMRDWAISLIFIYEQM